MEGGFLWFMYSPIVEYEASFILEVASAINLQLQKMQCNFLFCHGAVMFNSWNFESFCLYYLDSWHSDEYHYAMWGVFLNISFKSKVI